jgi:RNA polymerase sigma factor (sigma-70 family)
MSQSMSVADLRGAGSQEAASPDFADIFGQYHRPIFNYLLRMTQNQAEAEDLTQETFIRVDRRLRAFRGEASLSNWIYRIATNVSLDHLRRTATRQAKTALSLEETESGREWILDEAASPPEQVAVQDVVSHLAGCPDCSRELGDLHTSLGWLRKTYPEQAPPGEMWEKLQARTETQ